MNYMQTLRTYCLQNTGKLFDAGYMWDKYFHMIPKKTFMKNLNRLEDEGIVKTVSKGVFIIGDVDFDSAVLDFYAGGLNGMVVGKQLYYDMGIIEQPPETVVIRTNAITTKHKNVGKYKLIKAGLYFGKQTKSIIRMLELIQNGLTLSAAERVATIFEAAKYASDYEDCFLEEVLREIPYLYSTIVPLSKILQAVNIPNNCIDVYNQIFG